MFTILLVLLVAGLVAGVWWVFVRGWIVPAAVVLWTGYAAYETWVQATCTGECNIRVDLLLVWPLLLAVTVLAVVSAVLRAVRRRKTRESGTFDA
jgi:hypothetical protein